MMAPRKHIIDDDDGDLSGDFLDAEPDPANSDDVITGDAPERRRSRNICATDLAPKRREFSDAISLDGENVELDEDLDEVRTEPESRAGNKIARQKAKQTLAAAWASFGPFTNLAASKPREPRDRGESWPLFELVQRIAFEPDNATRERMLGAAVHIRHLSDDVAMDVAGISIHLPGKSSPPDYDMQRYDDGKVVYELGQSLDRKSRTYESKNGEIEARRFDGPVKIVRGGRVDNCGFDVHRDDPAALRKINARLELDEIIAAVGPLWKHLLPAICDNATATEVGQATGAKGTQAPGVGTKFISVALCAAAEVIDRINAERAGASSLALLHSLPDSSPVSAGRLKRALKLLQTQ
jgi:hypothetical protein